MTQVFFEQIRTVLNKSENAVTDLNIGEKQKYAIESNILKDCLPMHSQVSKYYRIFAPRNQIHNN
jgi:hypothetical protein